MGEDQRQRLLDWGVHTTTHPQVFNDQCSPRQQKKEPKGERKDRKMADKKADKKAKKDPAPRTRNFACVVYPESAPEQWREYLCEQFIPAFISPLHDRDENPTGERKKAHYHVIIMFDSLKTTEQARAVFEKIGGVGCEIVQSIRGYSRYLCHLDNPEKAQYSAEDVTQLCGADYNATIGLATDRYKAIAEMIDFCVFNDIFAYSVLLEYSRLNRADWFRILCDNGTVVVKEYLKSREWEHKQHVQRTYVRRTTELHECEDS